MIRGTTPTLEFVLPFDADQLQEAYVTLAQSGSVLVEKSLADCEHSGNKLTVKLTQDDTLKLKAGALTEIQIRAKMIDGNVLASQIILERTERILKDGVI